MGDGNCNPNTNERARNVASLERAGRFDETGFVTV